MSGEEYLVYLRMTDDALELFFGDQLLKDSLGALPVTPEMRRSLGRNWFEQNLSSFRKAVCGHPLVQSYRANKRAQDRVLIVGAIADSIGSAVGVVPVAAVAAMIWNYGLDELCGEPAS